MSMTYDDRLIEPITVDGLMDVAKEIAIEAGAEHYDHCYHGDVCGMCVEDTPLSKENAAWMGLATSFDDFAEDVEERVRGFDEDEHWVRGELSEQYLMAFRDAACEPADCVLCTKQIIGEDEECGHERNGEPCPAANTG